MVLVGLGEVLTSTLSAGLTYVRLYEREHMDCGLTGHHEADEQADAERQVGERDARLAAHRAALQHYDG